LATDGKTYASTGGSGSVTVHSALPSSEDMMDSDLQLFGTRLVDLPTGRSKFGLFVDHSPVDDNKIATSSETGQVSLSILHLIPEVLKHT
jgi:WD repeat-containing protein 61